MTQIDVGCRLVYDVADAASFHFLVAAAETTTQRIVRDEFVLDPPLPCVPMLEPGTANQFHVVTASATRVEVTYRATVERDAEPRGRPTRETGPALVPPEVLAATRPSRYCQSDLLTRRAAATFGTSAPGYERVLDIADWVHDHLEYVSGDTDAETTAIDVLVSGAGVCRDFAHLSIALCRALQIPARYVSAYAVDLDPPDFHGVFEAFIDGAWYLFDATRMASPDQLVRIGGGRDAADVAFATYNGDVTAVEQQVDASIAAAP